MNQDPKSTMPAALAQAFANAVIQKGRSKPVEHAAPASPKPPQQPKEQK